MQRIRKAVIPVAGRATRLHPASYAIAKGLFPLVDRDGRAKPVIHLILEEAFRSGIEQACLVTGPGEDAPYRHYASALTESGEKTWQALARGIEFAVQPTPEGYGHAVLCARDFAAGEPVLVMLGDHVYRSTESRLCARQVLDCFHTHQAATSGVQRTPEDQIGGFGTIAGRALADDPRVYDVADIVEKPAVNVARQRLRVPGLPDGTYLCWFGLHAMTNAIFDVLAEDVATGRRERGEFQFTGAQARLAAGERYLAYEVAGQRFDMGDPPSYVATQAALWSAREHGTG